MRRHTPSPSLLLAAGLAALAGCDGAADRRAAYDTMPRLSVVPGVEICAGRDDAPCQLANALVVAVAPDGRVAVADMGGELREFDRDARYLRQVGQRGGGPGEYRALVAAGYDPQGNLTLLDQRGMRVQRFDTAGRPLGAVTAPMVPGLLGVTVVQGRIALLALPGAAAVGDTVEARAVLVDPVTGDTTALPGVPEPAIATGDGSVFPLTPLFTVMPSERMAVSPDGALHLADGGRLRIVRRDADGGAARVLVDLAVAPRPITATELEAEAARHVPLGPPMNAAAAAQHRRQLDAAIEGAPSTHPMVTRLAILDDGTLLARESAPASADSVRWNAFAADGAPVGHLFLPVRARVAGGRLARLLVVAPDGDDVPHIRWLEARR